MLNPMSSEVKREGMTPLRKAVTVLGVVVGLAFFAYPPWTEVYTAPDGSFRRVAHGYHFLWNKPEPQPDHPTKGVRIHSSELSPRIIAVAIATIGANLFIKSREKKRRG